jgi:2-(1,2-epoxy-1,2-dihydrophenyl)acetyl-CoA isomerase
MSYEKIQLTRHGDVAVITLNDPQTLNASSPDMARELMVALSELDRGENAVRALVITGAGRGFCSGANLQSGSGYRDEQGGFDAGALLDSLYNPLVNAIRDLAIPLVTAVNGAAAGIGCSIALLGDLIVAGESAYFLQAFSRIGLAPDGGSSYLLPRLIGKARAMEMALLGEKISAAQALEWGLINRCVPDAELMPQALALAGKLASGPASLGMIRKVVWAALDADWASQLAYERNTQRAAGRTEDFREGVAAFLGKRSAAFKGR